MKHEWKKGDVLEAIEDHEFSEWSLMKGEKVTLEYPVSWEGDGEESIYFKRADGTVRDCYAKRFKKVSETVEETKPLTDLKGGSKKVEKKIINVLVVDKKTGKEVKNENVVAVDTTSALLKAYKIDSESLFIKTTEVGSYQEEPKPVEVVMSNKK